jgi:hypothetical protein
VIFTIVWINNTKRQPMIPSLKLQREIRRVWLQFRGIGERLTDPIAQRRLDLVVASGLPQINGKLAASDKVALILVYKPFGLENSTIETCRWLGEHGYAPLVISNAPIRPKDREKLASVVWRAVERPNFGYDFGGYRDGLTCLAQWGEAPSELLILNDSVWVQSLPKNNLIARLAADPAEIAGTILRSGGSVQFLESYLYRLRRPALEHPAFAAFWARLRLTSNKYHVIRRGERGFSEAMLAAGLQVSGVYDSAGLAGKIAEQDEKFLRLTLRYGAYVDLPLAAQRDQILAHSGGDWRKAALEHVACVMEKRQGYSSFPYAMVLLTGYPLLKKSTDPVSRAWRAAHLAAVESGDLPSPSPAILAEMLAQERGK